jgi:hypothetical protein
MAITSIGYDGTVDESDWTKLMGSAATYGVADRSHWKVTTHATLTRGVSIATGSGWGHGVYDTSDATVSLAGATISSGTRWDMVVARRNWSGTGGSTSFAIITGTSTKALPVRNVIPGSLDDQPIALVQFTAGQSAATAIVDLRIWAGSGGGLYAQDILARDYTNGAGTRLFINGEDWVSTTDASGNQAWVRASALQSIQLFGNGAALVGGAPPAGTKFLVQSGTQQAVADGGGYSRVTWPVPFPNGLLYCAGMSGDDWATGGGGVNFASSGWEAGHGASGYGDRFSWVYAVLSQDAATKNYGRIGGKNHRINWIAIGW